MKIEEHWPEFDAAEAQRFWLTAIDLCDLAAVGDATDPKMRNMLNHLSDRGHVPFVKSGKSRTAPRHYSLVSALMLRIILDLANEGRTYVYGTAVAKAAAELMLESLNEAADSFEQERNLENTWIIHAGIAEDGCPKSITVHRGDSMPRPTGFHFSVVDLGYMIWRVCDLYADRWRDDLQKRGIIEKPPPIEIGEDGYPIQPEGRKARRDSNSGGSE